MVILLACEQPALRRGLATRLRELTPHRILTASTPAEMMSAVAEESSVDLLLFTPELQEGAGREARGALRTRFPGLQAVAIEDGTPETLAAQVVGLLATTAPAPAPPPPSPAAPAAPGEILGDYELTSLIRSTPTTGIYRAVQYAVNRQVALERLNPECTSDEEAVRKFRRTIRARAHVTHPHIAAVYEAQECDGMLYYTRELIRGQNLEELAAARLHLPQEKLLHILQVAAEAFTWMAANKIPHEPVLPIHLFLGPDGVARVANIAVPEVAAPLPPGHNGIAGIARALQRLLSGPSRELNQMLSRMQITGPQALSNWPAVGKAARQALDSLADSGAGGHRQGGKHPAARQRLLIAGVGFLALAAGGWGTTAWLRNRQRAAVRDLSAMVHIPAGAFLYQKDERRTLPEFWIDKYEVTLSAYSAFLDALPHGDMRRFDHPDQPAAKAGHKPPDWEEVLAAATAARTWKGQPITLNVPVFNVDWWDAWAYARWKGRRLPTDEEWERAARGTNGRFYPWGAAPDPTRANTGIDHNAPAPPGQGDGHAYWCDADAMPGDESSDGVIGMAGNVAEWTSTLAPHPDIPDVEVPAFRGGDFHLAQPVPLNVPPWLAKNALYAQPFLGFRTATSTAPPGSPP